MIFKKKFLLLALFLTIILQALLYTNNYIEKKMTSEHNSLVYHRRNTRSYSETDYLMLNSIIELINEFIYSAKDLSIHLSINSVFTS